MRGNAPFSQQIDGTVIYMTFFKDLMKKDMTSKLSTEIDNLVKNVSPKMLRGNSVFGRYNR